MSNPELDFFLDNYYVYKCLVDNSLVTKQLRRKLETEADMSQSTAYRKVDNLSKKDEGIETLVCDGDEFSINKELLKPLFIEMLNDFHMSVNDLAEFLGMAEKQSEKADKIEEAKQIVSQKVILRNSVDIEKRDGDLNKIFCYDSSLFDEEYIKQKTQMERSRNSYFDEHIFKDESKELNESNSRKKTFERLFTGKFFDKRKEDIEVYSKNAALNESQKRKIDKEVDDNRKLAVLKIKSDSTLTNKEKLTLYTMFSRWHGTEMEELINAAGDYCICAEHVISLLDMMADKDVAFTKDEVRDFFRQAQKASEVKIKKEFAQELVDGDYYITASVDGEVQKFAIVPEEDILRIKKILNMSDSVSTSNHTKDMEDKLNSEKTSESEMESVDNFAHESIPLSDEQLMDKGEDADGE